MEPNNVVKRKKKSNISQKPHYVLSVEKRKFTTYSLVPREKRNNAISIREQIISLSSIYNI